jgi:hypothetical protein
MYRGIIGNRGPRCTAVIGAVLTALLWAAGSSQAEMVTVGPALPMPVGEGIIYGCDANCVLTNTGPVDGSSDVSPVDGVVLSWRLYHATPYGEFSLRILSPQGQGYVGAGRSASEFPVREGAAETFSTRLPVKAGQLIGLELEDQQAGMLTGYAPGAKPVLLEPAMADGVAGAPPPWWNESPWTGVVFPFNVEILPAPTIARVNASQGPGAGGNQVIVTGENFAEVTEVSFGSAKASYVVHSESELIATVPAGSAASSVPVSVVTAAGRAEAPTDYAYEPAQAAAPAPVPGCLVPRLKGRRLKAVRHVLSRDGCRLVGVKRRRDATARSGRVNKQSPPPGAKLPFRGGVEVTLSITR